MLRALLWIELCSTWWWWFVILLPFAVTRQITSLTPHDLIDVNLNLLMPVVAGLGIASGLRDRQGIRAALVRHGTPGRVLAAKLMVPAILMPLYYVIGQAISRELSERAVHVGSLHNVPDGNPLILAPIFCAGVATGLRQARWWATRFAPLAAVATLSILAQALQPWNWIWDISGSRWDEVVFNLTVMQVIIAVLITVPCVWWCFAAMREANGEDGPSSRTAMAWCTGMASCGLFMAPGMFISDRWEYLLEHRTVTTAGPHPIEYAQPVFPALSINKLLTTNDRWPNYRVSSMVEEYLFGGSIPGGGSIDLDWRNKRVCVRKKDGVATQIPVLIRGTDGMDGTMPLDEAWSRLHLSLGQYLMDRWHNLEVGFSGGASGRIIQNLDQRPTGDTRPGEDRIYWTVTDDPALVRLHLGVGAPSRLFQVDTWSGPMVVLRPLTKDDPPFLRLFSRDRRLGIWEDHMTWTVGSHDPVQIPHPCTSAMPVHIEFQGDENVSSTHKRYLDLDFHLRLFRSRRSAT
jgi:hypothetical protein